jgi:hypothetical protein
MNLFKLLFTIFSATVTLRNCGNPATDQAIITGMGFTPSNPSPNENTTLWVAYDLQSPLTGGKATYSVTLNGIPFTPTVYDLCTQTLCPKEIGSYNETSNSLFPSGISGKIVSKVQWANQNQQPVWCLETTFKI